MINKRKILDDIRIIPFEAPYRSDFRDLNLAWVAKYFTVEAKDHEQLENPQERIIDGAESSCLRRMPAVPLSAAYR